MAKNGDLMDMVSPADLDSCKQMVWGKLKNIICNFAKNVHLKKACPYVWVWESPTPRPPETKQEKGQLGESLKYYAVAPEEQWSNQKLL